MTETSETHVAPEQGQEPADALGSGAEEAFRKTAADLEWPWLCETLAARCQSEQGAARLASLRPAPTLGQAVARAELAREALDALDFGEGLPARAFPDVEELRARIARGGEARGDELRRVAVVLAYADELRAWARAQAAGRPALAAAVSSSPALAALRTEIDRTLEPDGRVSDAASVALRDARRRVGKLRQRMQIELARLCARYADVLRDAVPVERDGRYGLPVRADSHRSVPGIVLGTSATGVTLYVEPPEITELANELALGASEVSREEQRVLRELCHQIQALSEPLALAFEACVRADVLGALCQHAAATRAVVIVPDAEPRLALEGMRHPLLVARGVEVVPNDLALRSGQALVVSGPNAGGKTVALKCLGLAAWMARAGVPVPARRESRIGFFDEVLSDIGDAQSLAQSLSTFSAHVANLGRIVGRAAPRVLVLLDEAAGGTDPEEGAALAVAVLETLLRCGAAVAVTTHHERLKELGATDPRFANAAVGFDFERMLPTFRLALGAPGASSALEVATRFGLPPEVVARARTLLSGPARDRERLVRELELERSRLETERAAAEAERAAATALRAELDAERATVRAREREKLARASGELYAEVKQARVRLRALVTELGSAARDPAVAERLRAAERRVDEEARLVGIDGKVGRALGADDAAERRPVDAPALRPGARVWVARLGAVAEVVSAPDRGQVEVKAGAFTLRVPVGELATPSRAQRTAGGEARAAREQQRKERAARGAAASTRTDTTVRMVRTSSATCDLRGQRVDEAVANLERFLDDCARAGEAAAFVLHGHGTGALRNALREHLATHPRVAALRPAAIEEGGDAFTVVWLRA
ncbi:MAG: Smr/MutS family protein [Myxococcales bacterium]|nr:Smr/MutS family protein [Myxococcales bacterium]